MMREIGVAIPDGENSGPSTTGILLVLLFVVVGMTCNDGAFSWHGLVLVLAATGLGIALHIRGAGEWISAEWLLPGVLVVFAALACLFIASGQNETEVVYHITFEGRRVEKFRLSGFGITIKVLTAIALGGAVAYGIGLRRRMRKHLFTALIAIAAVARVLMLFSTPVPRIDVFVSQTYGAWGLLKGRNVYQMEFPSPYIPLRVRDESRAPQSIPVFDKRLPYDYKTAPWYKEALQRKAEFAERFGYELKLSFDHYGYPPAVLYGNFLSWHLFKDVRALWLICDLLAALCIYLVARRMNPRPEQRRFCELVTLAFLFLPRTLFVLEQSWTEPLVLASLGGLAAAMAYRRGPALSGPMLGLWLSSKQYVALGIPLILKLRRLRLSAWVGAIALGVVLVLPFAIWDFGALWHDVFGFFLKSDPRVDALSIYGALARQGWETPWWVVVPVWLGGLAFFTWRMRRTLAGWLFSTACIWLFFFMLGKQAFMNYFHLIAFTLLLAVAASSQGTKPESAPRT